MRYRLIIFDWDGTLMDSLGHIVACMQAASRDVGWGELTADQVRDIIGLGLPEAIAQMCPGIGDDQAEALKQRYAHYFVAGDPSPMAFYPGVTQGLQQLQSTQELRLAVATGKSRRGLDRVFRQSGCGDWFHASRTADETRSKPHPQMLEELLETLDVPIDEAVMIGDSVYDMEMARALGMDRLAVSYGVHDADRLAASRPVMTADSFPELLHWLRA
ncbi:HAD-IA family hydrolase [Halomonas sp. 18H]|uniref:HAD family hydrolase n=1 Tax=Halomonas almeriensis TaxID=308163 RepID=UPI0022312E9C|nr:MULTISPECIES: HAD-IA family hydrolase [Halomonas]MCW4151687.1 HAD-IA family hydrolase [Halomonas sp. 18H]MDN3552823.1 HAD-IA family hydrolase [Halomonas almeriensis]